MLLPNRVMWAALIVAAGACVAAMLLPRAFNRRGNKADQSSRVDEASEDSFPASDPPSFSMESGAQAVPDPRS